MINAIRLNVKRPHMKYAPISESSLDGTHQLGLTQFAFVRALFCRMASAFVPCVRSGSDGHGDPSKQYLNAVSPIGSGILCVQFHSNHLFPIWGCQGFDEGE